METVQWWHSALGVQVVVCLPPTLQPAVWQCWQSLALDWLEPSLTRLQQLPLPLPPLLLAVAPSQVRL